jgi:Co/Zn/Cd efflux system component
MHLPGMDCATEEQLVRLALDAVPGVESVDVDLGRRTVTVRHRGDPRPITAAVSALGLGDGPEPGEVVASSPGMRRALWAVLVINAVMFVVELLAGLWAGSLGLVADSLDMLADAAVYAIALAAVGGALAAQRRSARVSGWLQLGLAGLILAEVVRRAVLGGDPQSWAMLAVGSLALAANVSAVLLLAGHRRAGVHMRASWIFTMNDAMANAGVIVAGVLVAVTGSQWPDLVAGAAISLLVASGAWRILWLRPGAPDHMD